VSRTSGTSGEARGGARGAAPAAAGSALEEGAASGEAVDAAHRIDDLSIGAVHLSICRLF